MKAIPGVGLRRAAVSAACTMVLAVVPVLGAQSPDPQGRAARLSSVDGKVQLSQGGQLLTDNAVINTPLFEGTRIITGDDGKAEVQFDNGAVARIPPDSTLALTSLHADASPGITLESGMGYFELEGGNPEDPTRIHFGSNTATVSGFTVFRLDLDAPPGALAVFSGNVHLESTSGLDLDLRGGESVTLSPDDPSQYQIAETVEPDSWDAWNADRDQALTSQEASSTPATRGMPDSNNPAWSDLNANGSWYDVPGQGYIWSPYEASNPGWDPFGMGYWMWMPAYGYVWVSSEPWGYMPYQCGAWNYYMSFGWGWAPGMCQPWWGGYGGGGGSWAFNVGTLPPRYLLPKRPDRPLNPRPGLQRGSGIRAVGPAPVIVVNRRMNPRDGMLPPRDKHEPVTIGGTTIAPVRPVPVRPRYSRPPLMGIGRPGTGTVAPRNSNRTVYIPAPSRPQPGAPRNTWPSGSVRPEPAPSRPSDGRGRNSSPPPAPRYSPPPAAPRYSPPPAPAPRYSPPPPAPHGSAPPPAPRSAPAPAGPHK